MYVKPSNISSRSQLFSGGLSGNGTAAAIAASNAEVREAMSLAKAHADDKADADVHMDLIGRILWRAEELAAIAYKLDGAEFKSDEIVDDVIGAMLAANVESPDYSQVARKYL